MNVCLLNDSFPPLIDGVANVVMNYASIMQEKLGAEVVVGTPRYPDADYSAYPYRVIPYQSVNITQKLFGYRAGNPMHWAEVQQIIDFGPEIIHTHCPAVSMIFARFLTGQIDVPLILTYHTKFDVDIGRAVGDGLIKKKLIKLMVDGISGCDEVWTVSHGAGENLKSLGYEGEYRVVSNGVDFAKGRVDDALVAEVTKDYDLPENVPVFLFVGRMMKYKGLPIILDALTELSGKGIDYRMVFVGGGADKQELEKTIRDRGIALSVKQEDGSFSHTDGAAEKSGQIYFAGPEHDRDRLRAWNTRADLFLFPSVYDTNGIVVREAAACGLASALVRGSCAAEDITDGRNGFLIEENGKSLAQLLIEVSGNLDALHETGQHAMDEIYISWEECVREAYDSYGDIIERKKAGLYPEKKKISLDYSLKAAADLARSADFLISKSKTFYQNMVERLSDET